MIAYEIVTGIEPFSELGEISPFGLINKIVNGYRPKFTKFVTDKMQSLISRCWSDLPKERPTFNEIFEELSNHNNELFFETIEESEVQEYIDLIFTNREIKPRKLFGARQTVNDGKLENEIKELKKKVSELQSEHDILFNSSHFLQLGLIDLLEDKQTRRIGEALIELKKSSDQGNCYASFIVGLIYEVGNEVEQNIKESFKYYEKSLKQGIPFGLRRIGRCYDNGRGVERDFSKAKSYYEKASELGDISALNSLGWLYKNGEGVKQNYTKAIEYYEKAAEFGNSNALANLGDLYYESEGVKQDYRKAIEYYEKAGELGNGYSLQIIGFLYQKGKGVNKDYTKAKEYYEKASKLGNETARKRLRDLPL